MHAKREAERLCNLHGGPASVPADNGEPVTAEEVDREMDRADVRASAFCGFALIKYQATRWNAQYRMLLRLHQLIEPTIEALKYLKGHGNDRASAQLRLAEKIKNNAALVTSLLELMGKFEQALLQALEASELSGAQYYSTILWVMNIKLANPRPLVSWYLRLVKSDLAARVPVNDIDKLTGSHLLAMLFHCQAVQMLPMLGARSGDALRQACDLARNVAHNIMTDEQQDSQVQTSEPLAKRMRLDDGSSSIIEEMLLEQQQQQNRRATADQTPLEEQLGEYLKMIDGFKVKHCTKSFWRNARLLMPELTMVAQYALAHTASSASSERAFSLAGLLLRDKRTSMKPDLLHAQMMIASNKKALSKRLVADLEKHGALASAKMLRDLSGHKPESVTDATALKLREELGIEEVDADTLMDSDLCSYIEDDSMTVQLDHDSKLLGQNIKQLEIDDVNVLELTPTTTHRD